MSTPLRTDDLPANLLAVQVSSPAPHEFSAFHLSGGWSVAALFLALATAAWQGYQGLLSSEPLHLALLGLTLIAVIGILRGFVVVSPNEAVVLTSFGRYVGTLAHPGLFWTHPLARHQRMSLRAMTFVSEVVKVNDARGTPIEMATAIVWRINDTARACFEVENPAIFVGLQSENALRSLAARYPYHRTDSDVPHSLALLSHPEVVAAMLKKEIQHKVALVGLEILDAQLTHLAYAPEIAQAMLRRQQADALVESRHTIVRGATELVKVALERLHSDGVVHLDASQRAIMVSNLMVALVAEGETMPVLNTSAQK